MSSQSEIGLTELTELSAVGEHNLTMALFYETFRDAYNYGRRNAAHFVKAHGLGQPNPVRKRPRTFNPCAVLARKEKELNEWINSGFFRSICRVLSPKKTYDHALVKQALQEVMQGQHLNELEALMSRLGWERKTDGDEEEARNNRDGRIRHDGTARRRRSEAARERHKRSYKGE